METIFDSLFDAITSCFDWLNDILVETGLWSVLLGTIVILMFWRMIINPLFGGRFMSRGKGSDRASSKNSQKSEDNA